MPSQQQGPLRPLHPLHAIFLAFPFPMFLGALLSDLAYWATFHPQWANFASWLIIGGMLARQLRRALGADRPVPRAGARPQAGGDLPASCWWPCGSSASSMRWSTPRMPGRRCRKVCTCRSITTLLALVAAWIGYSAALAVPKGGMMRALLLIGVAALALSACDSEPDAAAARRQPDAARAPARPAAVHDGAAAGGLGQRAPDRAAGLHDPRRSPRTWRSRARRWCCRTATSWWPKAPAAMRRRCGPRTSSPAFIKGLGTERRAAAAIG